MKQVVKVGILIGFVMGLSGFTFKSVGDIASMQVREDGLYNVLCMDGTFEVVSADDILADNVCSHQIMLMSGQYLSSTPSLCDMEVTANTPEFGSIRFDFPSCHGSYLEVTCEQNICTGMSANQVIRITIVDGTHYRWENQTYTSSFGDFERASDQNMLSRPVAPAMGSGIVGQP